MVENGTAQPGDVIDWAEWARRWDAQQEWHVSRREERFRTMLEMVAEVAGPRPGRILDLACGIGSISQRALDRFPDASLVALDVDPFLMEIGRLTLGSAGGQLTWVRADLRDARWPETMAAHAPFDAALSSTALHWLTAGDLARLYQTLAGLIRPGGLFLNADRMMLAPPAGPMSGVARSLRQRLDEGQRGPGESWDAWWEAARAEPGFRDLLSQRDRIFSDHPSRDEYITARFHEEALRVAGFAEAAVVWRYFDDTIVAGLR